MWLGELITEKGIGNGMSLLIFTSIAATFPTSLWSIKQRDGRWDTFLLVIAVGLLIIAAVVFVEQCQRRIPVTYAKRMIGRKMYGGTTTYIPLKVNQAGVIPVIFASSLLAIPGLIVQFQPVSYTHLDVYKRQEQARAAGVREVDQPAQGAWRPRRGDHLHLSLIHI